MKEKAVAGIVDGEVDIPRIETMNGFSGWRQWVGGVSTGGQAALSGLGAGELATLVLGAAGISTSIFAQIAAAGLPTILLGGVMGYLWYVQLKRFQEKVAAAKTEFEKGLEGLKKAIIDSVYEYTQLELFKKELRGKLNKGEDAGIANSEISSAQSKQKFLLAHIQTVLDKFSEPDNSKPTNYKAKLIHLFGKDGAPDDSWLNVFAQSHFKDDPIGRMQHFEEFKLISPVFLSELNTDLKGVLGKVAQVETISANIPNDKEVKIPRKEIKKAIKYGLLGLCGFFSGAGGTFSIGAIVGGVIAFGAVGWPVLIAVAAVLGVAIAVGSVWSYRSVEKKQEHTLNFLDKAVTQISSLSKHVSDENAKSRAKTNLMKSEYERKAIVNQLLSSYRSQLNAIQLVGDQKTKIEMLETLDKDIIATSNQHIENQAGFERIIKEVKEHLKQIKSEQSNALKELMEMADEPERSLTDSLMDLKNAVTSGEKDEKILSKGNSFKALEGDSGALVSKSQRFLLTCSLGSSKQTAGGYSILKPSHEEGVGLNNFL